LGTRSVDTLKGVPICHCQWIGADALGCQMAEAAETSVTKLNKEKINIPASIRTKVNATSYIFDNLSFLNIKKLPIRTAIDLDKDLFAF
jgi:hypothetical protein